jgi:hypothetical protein
LQLLDETPAPHGAERLVAHELANWSSAYWPGIDWTVQPYGRDGANLFARIGSGTRLLYSHLDTSLTGDPVLDSVITGRDDPYPPVREVGGRFEGFGLAVARAPAATALLAFVEAVERGASSCALLLAGSGTHRSAMSGSGRAGSGAGVNAYLESQPLPRSAIVAKCGPRGVLWQEPGALYLKLTVLGRHGAVLAPASATPAGGLAAHAGVVLAAVDAWRSSFVTARTGRTGQIGGQAGVGSMSYGSAEKPDLFGAQLTMQLYVVIIEADDAEQLADDLAATVRAAVAGTPLAECTVTVEAELLHGAAATAPDAPIVTAARGAWVAEHGAEDPIHDWTGSTDGVVLRGRGVDTARLGPSSRPGADDPRIDSLDIAELAGFGRIYAALLLAADGTR